MMFTAMERGCEVAYATKGLGWKVRAAYLLELLIGLYYFVGCCTFVCMLLVARIELAYDVGVKYHRVRNNKISHVKFDA